MLGESFDELMTPARLERRNPIARFAFGFTQFLEKAISDPAWARLVVQSAQSPTEFGRGVRRKSQGRPRRGTCPRALTVRDVELGADIVMGIALQIMRSMLERGARHNLTGEAREAMLRALGATHLEVRQDT